MMTIKEFEEIFEEIENGEIVIDEKAFNVLYEEYLKLKSELA